MTVTVYGPHGSLDTSFGGGKLMLPAGIGDDYARALPVQADGNRGQRRGAPVLKWPAPGGQTRVAPFHVERSLPQKLRM